MVKPEFIGIGAIALLFILSYPFVFAGTSGSIIVNGSDSNQVKVTVNDTTPGYLSDKLEAGPNIILSIQNPGADENILITATGSGFDTNCLVTGSCPTIVYQNQDANLNNIHFNGTISGGDFNYSLSDSNDSQSCPIGQALQSVGLTVTCVDVNASTGSGRTYTSGTPATIEVNNDTNTISLNFDGNFNVRINGLDLNNSLSYAKTDTNCSTSPDCNNNYFKLNPTANQTVSGGFSSNFTGAIQALLNQPIAVGNPAAARINDINFYGAFVQTNPDAGRGASVFPANRCAFEITSTEICFDFNNTSRSTGLREGMLNPDYYYKLGASSTNKGLRSYGPATSLYTQWGPNPSETIRTGDMLVMNYNDSNGIQQLLFQDNAWYHEDRKENFGTPKDTTIDQNSVGDTNKTGNTIQDGNFTLDSGADSNGFTISRSDGNINIFNYDLNGSITFYKTVNNSIQMGLKLHSGGTAADIPSFTGTIGCGLDATFGGGELFCTSSLTSLKTNIEDFNRVIDPEILFLLQPKLFNGIENPNGHKVAGLLAEEVIQVAPFFAIHDETGSLRGVDYKGLNILTIAALQAEHRKVLDLEQKINDINAELRQFKQGFCLQFPNNPTCIVQPGT